MFSKQEHLHTRAYQTRTYEAPISMVVFTTHVRNGGKVRYGRIMMRIAPQLLCT